MAILSVFIRFLKIKKMNNDNTPTNNPADEAKQNKNTEAVESIHELRPALDKAKIEKAVESAGPDRKHIMDKLDEKDHQ